MSSPILFKEVTMDLYNIPNDTGGDWRLHKFVEYQHEVPSIHYRVLGEYIKKYIRNKDDAVMLCWYMSCTYNEVTCVYLQETLDWHSLTKSNCKSYCRDYWDTNKEVLEFGSSRMYAKNMDWFPDLITQFFNLTKKKPYDWLKSFPDGIKGYKQLFKAISSLRFVGRFAGDLFMESVLYLNDFFGTMFKETSKLDWKKCSNLTSGLLNIFYLDEEANEFDRSGTLSVSEEFLTEKLNLVQEAIHSKYPEQSQDGVNLFIGKICSFRNLFKASRYGGFHHDRELGVLRRYEENLPDYKYLWDRIYSLRACMFDDRFLGENHDWNDIRKERKKLWLRQGLTGVEDYEKPQEKTSEKTSSKPPKKTPKKDRVVVNIRGCNGSGKSTIPMSIS